MTSRNSVNRAALLFMVCMCLILLTDSYAVRSFGTDQQLLNYALLFDFVFVIPLMYWLLIVRKKGGGMLKVLQAAVPCIILAWIALPASGRSMLTAAPLPLKLALTALEVLIIAAEARLAYILFKRIRGNLRLHGSMVEALRLGTAEHQTKPSVFSSLIVNDILMVYYLIFSWKRKPVISEPGVTLFSYHRKTGQIVLAAVFTHVIAIEAFGIHLLVRQWSDIAAWILSAADLWLLSLLWADSRASAIQPLEARQEQLRIRYGMRIQADVPYGRITAIDTALEFHPDKEESRHAALPVVTPNVRIELAEPIMVQTLLFMPRKVKTIYLALDEPSAFAQMMRGKCHFLA
ncbi:hypothetical protein J23TS9_40230 [Paenibacillus sp. J23TS9]|uniref:hypothetical protein n=1 Tax=Paenibacillus sp. J23TS9 TaxID=2807193 RepID=UPI001B192C4B|nr:hypothetical protein [Paenibacillus sp. J23TS9]GIP28893.1 hypothetical protein J23TS9_40230 [Paenibacillus sp. J23TS9]